MPDPIADIADPEVQGELDGLRLLVEETDGNVIAFVRYERVTEREAGIRYLKDQLSIPVVERVLSEERKNPLTLLDTLPDERCCVQLCDLEEALPEVTGYLNVNREAYADVLHALVFWVGEHGLREVAQNAPDFWAWRSGVFDVRSEHLGLVQLVSQGVLAEDVRFTDRGDLERRVRLYEKLIEEYEEAGEEVEYLIRLRYRLAATLQMLGELEASEREARRVKVAAREHGDEELIALAHHLLGRVSQARHRLGEAEEWYRKALKTFEQFGDKRQAATTYHQLGTVTQMRRDFEEAEKWYQKADKIFGQLEDEHRRSATLHEMGRVAHARRNLEEAEQWYREALNIRERLNDEYGAAQTYHQLGMLARERRNFEEAEKWCHRSMQILKRLGDKHSLAKAYHGLGIIAQEQQNFEKAERWYRKSMEIAEQLQSEEAAARIYHQLGVVAQKQQELEKAEKWYRKSAKIFERLDDERGAAFTYGQQGHLARERGNLREAGQWLLKAIRGFATSNDERSGRQAVADFVRMLDDVPPDIQDDLRQQWIDAGHPPEQLDDLLKQARAEKSG